MQQQQRMEQIRTQAELAKMREDVAGALEERTAAQENVANAQLDRVKAMKELEKMDADRLKILADALKTVTGDQGAQGRGTTRQRRMTRR
jgi:Spy/CpxP family protein refolding chaperone